MNQIWVPRLAPQVMLDSMVWIHHSRVKVAFSCRQEPNLGTEIDPAGVPAARSQIWVPRLTPQVMLDFSVWVHHSRVKVAFSCCQVMLNFSQEPNWGTQIDSAGDVGPQGLDSPLEGQSYPD